MPFGYFKNLIVSTLNTNAINDQISMADSNSDTLERNNTIRNSMMEKIAIETETG